MAHFGGSRRYQRHRRLDGHLLRGVAKLQDSIHGTALSGMQRQGRDHKRLESSETHRERVFRGVDIRDGVLTRRAGHRRSNG